MVDLALLLSGIYLTGMAVFTLAIHRQRLPPRNDYRPKVSVVIAARNEESILRQCLESVVKLTYPPELLEVIIVDDNSADQTGSIGREFSARYSHVKVTQSKAGNGTHRGKVNALVHGIEVSTGEILMFTDADCTVPPEWVEQTVKYYDSENVGIVAGFLAIRARNWFGSVQALDWYLLLSAAAATIGLNFPVTAVGNNFSIRRSAYDKVGGYRGIPFSVTEDLALVRAVTQPARPTSRLRPDGSVDPWGVIDRSGGKHGMSARLPLDPKTLVVTEPCASWRELYGQKKRWFIGGRGAKSTRLAAFGVVYLYNLVLILSILFLQPSIWLPLLCVKVIADLILVWPALRRFRQGRLILYFLPFELFYIVYVLLFPPLVLISSSVTWKGRRHEND